MLSEMLQIALLVLGSLGGGGLIVVGLSGWLGKVWADRITQKERAAYEREIEDFKAKALQSLEQEKASYQRGLEEFKAQLNRDSELVTQTLRERVTLYKESLAPVLELYLTGFEMGAVDQKVLLEFERKRLVTSATLGMFAPLPVFEAYNETIDYLQDCYERKKQFDFAEFRRLGFIFLNAIRRDLGVHTEDLKYTGPR